MAILSLVRTYWSDEIAVVGETARLIVLGEADAPVVSVHNTGMSASARIALASGGSGTAGVTTRTVAAGSGTVAVTFEGATCRLDVDALAGLESADAVGRSASLWMDGRSFVGASLAACRLDDLVFLSARTGAGISVYRAEGASGLTPLFRLNDTAGLPLERISAMAAVATSGGDYLVAASQGSDALAVLRVGEAGRLTPVSQLGSDQALPILCPTQVNTLVLNGQAFVVVGSFGSSSITVLRLAADGSLGFADQVIDSLTTRFAGLSAMDVITVAGRTMVAAAGCDGGVTLFQLLPNGRLVLLETLVDSLESALCGAVDLRFVQSGARVELVLLAGTDAGVTRILIDPGRYDGDTAGIATTGTTGTAGDDVMTAPAGGARVNGAEGDDILISGSGRDVLTGGSGRDLFLMLPDANGRDVIADFNPAEDRIDLSAFPMLYGPGDLNVVSTATGAQLRFDTVVLTLTAGRMLARDEVLRALSFETDRVVSSAAASAGTYLAGTSGNDSFLWLEGAQTYDAGAGRDEISYAAALAGAVLDLQNQETNSGAAAGDVLQGIEAIVGTAHADRIYGDAANNTFVGGAGNDRLEGRAGDDWITPGTGVDSVDGGDGTDMVSFVDAAARVVIDLPAGTAIIAGETNRLSNVENVTGTVFADLVTGDAGANLIRALGDYDWLVGSGGQDTFDGGTGRDTVAYSSAPSGVTASLVTMTGTAGQAAGDSYVLIESLTGSSHADRLQGDGQRNVLRGLGGDDFIFGGAGRDIIEGGPGRDAIFGGLDGDRIFGGSGNDTLNGEAGWDAVIYLGRRADYAVTSHEGGRATVLHLNGGTDGLDVLTGIEVIEFADARYYL